MRPTCAYPQWAVVTFPPSPSWGESWAVNEWVNPYFYRVISLLFWLVWVLNLLLLITVVSGNRFRLSFGAEAAVSSSMILLLGVLILVTLVLKVSGRHKWWSLVLVLLPFLFLLTMYLIEKRPWR